ncbi:hypothetical protein [Bradyrhizobium sp. JYMT SZCCT0428]|uniref:hypothetical protein n=1 Tax=Bradyrhizobium sp. JYMT SZCCT0428 TaxID=2807673 RepID=UPI001BAB835E|nr:hypothetical protein [Bradyrhizobium sp. JYMT SZCCT0428]MBR1155266.1 hypothetical protein [Bradyrhizobium sp. JYMT SZCCT0428]
MSAAIATALANAEMELSNPEKVMIGTIAPCCFGERAFEQSAPQQGSRMAASRPIRIMTFADDAGAPQQRRPPFPEKLALPDDITAFIRSVAPSFPQASGERKRFSDQRLSMVGSAPRDMLTLLRPPKS